MFKAIPISALLGKMLDELETGQNPIEQNLFPTLGY
jgi:hypothetical protein